ncbi:MAG: ATP-binding protein [Candidatus Melainabacteria bacterium]
MTPPSPQSTCTVLLFHANGSLSDWPLPAVPPAHVVDQPASLLSSIDEHCPDVLLMAVDQNTLKDASELGRLIHDIRIGHPHLPMAWLTNQPLDAYIRPAKKLGITHVLAGASPFTPRQIEQLITHLRNPLSAFGIQGYLSKGTTQLITRITNSAGIMDTFQSFRELLTSAGFTRVHDVMTAVIEAMTNAVYHVAQNDDGSLKYEKGQQIDALAENEIVTVSHGMDEDTIAISISDQGGRITTEEILYWLDRNAGGKNLMDTHGRGVYLMYALVDRVIINIRPGAQTEIIMLCNRQGVEPADADTTPRSLMINVVPGAPA